MKKFLVLLLVTGSLICSAQNNVAPAQPTGTQTSPNLVYSTVNPWQGPAGSTSPGTWSGFDVTQSTGGGVSGGAKPGYNIETSTFMFGYTQNTINYNYAVSTALKNSGMTWLGYNYSWEYKNQDMTRGTLSANVTFNAANGTQLHSKNWTLPKTEEGWTTVTGTETFVDPAAVANINSFNLSFSGKDDRFWAGFYGPVVRYPSISVNYSFDACSSNPLSSPSCPGYAEAYKTQQCTANPLYDASCPGYAVAYKTQQCAINPLFDPTCPGWAEAYKTQQCTLDPLYDKTCSGYDQAYLNQQCIKDSLYSNKCEGYATAYAIKYLVKLDPAVTTAVNQQLTTTQETYKNDPANIVVVNTTVDSVLATPATTSSTSALPTSVTSVVTPQSAVATPATPVINAANSAAVVPPTPPARIEERAQDQRRAAAEVGQVERRAGNNPEEAKREVDNRAKNLAQTAARAVTLEAQTANQGVLVGLMSYVPGFAGYQQATVPDTLGRDLAMKYSKPSVDNARAQRLLGGAQERRWQEMVDSQYNNGN